MRLFTAIWPDAAANDDVDARLAVADLDERRRVTPPESRHVTLRFHGEADPATLSDRLRDADLDGVAGLRVRCHGAGTFSSALWLGVEADDPARLAALVAAAGGDPATHVAHLTIARGHRGVPASLPTRAGPWWSVTAIHLAASPSPYRTVARVEVPNRDPGKLR